MRKLHLANSDPNLQTCVMYCGAEDKNDNLDWTYNRKKVTQHPRGCKKCIELSKPEPPVPIGFAAAQLNKLEYYNQLSRNPPEVILLGLDKIVVEHLHDGIESATLVALTLEENVSTVIEVLHRLFLRGVVTKARRRWIADEEPIPMRFNLVDPITMASGRIINRV